MDNTANQPTQGAEYYNDDFNHGYSSGLEQVNRESYEGYLSSQVSLEWLNERIAEKKEEISGHLDKMEAARNSQKTAHDELQRHLLTISQASKESDRLKKELIANEYQTATLQERYESQKSKYSLVAGILYLVAGLSFLAGDLIISHEIVAYALNIRNSFEAWAFAIGLAMLSILLKPAYERLVEAPYLENRNERARTVYAWFKGILVAFSLVTLFILGWFRYEAYKTDKLKEAINKNIRSLQLQQNTALNPASGNQTSLLEQMDRELQKIEGLNQGLVTSQWALLSFVLSGILFAVAGAVCLGIALPVLQCYWLRWMQINPHIRRLRRRKGILTDDLNHAEETVANGIVQKNILENDLLHFPKPDVLEAQLKVLKEDLSKLLNDKKFAEIDSRNASFSDGYEKGQVAREMMNEEELAQFKNSYFTIPNLAAKASSSPSDKAVGAAYRRNSLRPYQQIRKMITDDFGGEKPTNQ